MNAKHPSRRLVALDGDKIRQLRLAKGWQVQQLARAAKMSEDTLGRVGSGVSERNARIIAATLGVELSEIVSIPLPVDRRPLASNITIRIPRYFIGRDTAIAQIADILTHDEGRVAITALHGMRGVGKTVLAATFAELSRDKYFATWWIRAHSEDTIRSDLVDLGVRLGWAREHDSQDNALRIIGEKLEDDSTGLLLIFDNAPNREAVSRWLPRRAGAHILITSNSHIWRGSAALIEIHIWPKTVGADYLIARTGRLSERAAAEALSEALGGLPLAHEMAAAYCEERDLPFDVYRQRLLDTPVKLLDDLEFTPGDYGLTVAKAFSLAIDEAAKLHWAAEPLLLYTTVLAAEPIPLYLFTEGSRYLHELPDIDENEIEKAVVALRKLALAEREMVPDERESAIYTDSIRLHRLVRAVAVSRRDQKIIMGFRRDLIATLSYCYPFEIYDKVDQWPRGRRLDGIVLGLVGNKNESPLEGTETDFAKLLTGLGQYRFGALGAYSAAKPFFERSLAVCEGALGPNDIRIADSLADLGLLHENQGHLEMARPFFERALAICEQAGIDHPETATALNNLGWLLQLQGELDQARSLHERAVAISERVFGAEHQTTATTLNTLAAALHRLGEIAAARPIYERALYIREKVCGAQHPDTAISLNDLAMCMYGLGDSAAAQQLFEKAVVLSEKIYGPEHPRTLLPVGNLAGLFDTMGDAQRGAPLHARVIEGLIRVHGPTFPGVLTQQNNMAHGLRAAGHPDLAEAYARACAENTPGALGADHPLYFHRRNNLAITLLMLGKNEEAKTILAETLATMDEQYAIITAAAVYLLLLSEMMDGSDPSTRLVQLKVLLVGPPLRRSGQVADTWNIDYLLEYLSSRVSFDQLRLLKMLLAAINDTAQLPELDRFPAWREAQVCG